MTTRRSHILVVKPLFPMAKALQIVGMDVTALWSSDHFWRTIEEASLTPNIDFLEWKPSSRAWVDLARLTRMIRSLIVERGVQVVHVNALNSLLPAFLATHLLKPGHPRPVIAAMSHNARAWQQPRTARLAATLIRHLADGFVALSTLHQEQLISLGVPASMTVMIPNPYDRDWLAQLSPESRQARPPATPIRILNFASLCPEKAQHLLLQAAAQVVAQHPHVEFVLVGEEGREPGYRQRLLALVDELQLQGQVTLAGLVPHSEMMQTIAKADIVVLPTLVEMMPQTVIEGMIVGRPVVAFAVGGVLDLVQQRQTGLLVQPGDVEGLADALCELITDSGLAFRLAKAGQDFALQYCDPERVGRQFQEFYEQL